MKNENSQQGFGITIPSEKVQVLRDHLENQVLVA
jgi:hypothetical protein